MRTLDELVDAHSSGWPRVAQMLRQATNHAEVLPGRHDLGERTLLGLQVTTRSQLGAIAYETGGILVDRGWLRILGSSHRKLPRDLARWNYPRGETSDARLPGAFLVADDVVGGFFAVNGGALPGPYNHVMYLAPDTLEWEDTGRGYTDFLEFALCGDIAGFYVDERWTGWEDDVPRIGGSRGIEFAPMLFTRSSAPLDRRHRREVPVEELWRLHAVELPRQLRGEVEPSDELSRAVVLYLGHGQSPWPRHDEGSVVQAFGPDHAGPLMNEIKHLQAELDSLEVDWSMHTLDWAGEAAREELHRLHPDLSAAALDALAWQFTYEWR